VLVVDDQIGDLRWLLDLIRNRGYGVVLATNEKTARERFEAVKGGVENYTLAIVDVMVAVKDLMDLIKIDEKFFEDSKDTGIRLCRYAREELGISADRLPIACLTVRDDDAVKSEMARLGIPLFNRAPYSPSESIRNLLDEKLRPIQA